MIAEGYGDVRHYRASYYGNGRVALANPEFAVCRFRCWIRTRYRRNRPC
ncbi:hypothetical protein OK016_05760 [Vibrio chagasii]|nr:hypothetical protein [Vibrio chagasii]